jgi:predicted N-acetyltransferase YhbS
MLPSMPNMPLVVRDARPDERDVIRALTMRAYAEYANVMEPDAWASLYEVACTSLDTRLPAQRLVAERDGRVVGSVMLFPPIGDASFGGPRGTAWPELRLLAVAHEERGRGASEALVAACVERAREEGASAIGLHAVASMQAGIRLYERLGFVRAPELDFEPQGAEPVLGYRLSLADDRVARPRESSDSARHVQHDRVALDAALDVEDEQSTP